MMKSCKVVFNDGTIKYFNWLNNADSYAKEKDLYIVDIVDNQDILADDE